jgi:hypothetical protein
MLLLQVTPIADSSSRSPFSFSSVSAGTFSGMCGTSLVGFTDFKSNVLLAIPDTDSLRFESASTSRLLLFNEVKLRIACLLAITSFAY